MLLININIYLINDPNVHLKWSYMQIKLTDFMKLSYISTMLLTPSYRMIMAQILLYLW